MSNKFWREAREYTKLFLEEYEIDPDWARSNLDQRLKDKRKKIQDVTYWLIGNKIDD